MTIAAFWNWLAAQSDLAKWPLAPIVMNEMGEHLWEIDPGLGFEFTKRPNSIELAISANGVQSLFALVEKIVAAAPTLPFWSLRFANVERRGLWR